MNSGREKCSLKTTEGSGFLVQSLGRSRNIPAPTDASKTTNTTVGKSQRSCSEKMRLYFQNGPNNHFYFMSFNIQTFFLFFSLASQKTAEVFFHHHPSRNTDAPRLNLEVSVSRSADYRLARMERRVREQRPSQQVARRRKPAGTGRAVSTANLGTSFTVRMTNRSPPSSCRTDFRVQVTDSNLCITRCTLHSTVMKRAACSPRTTSEALADGVHSEKTHLLHHSSRVE